MGKAKQKLVWHCGKQTLSVIDTESMKSLYSITEYTPNTVVRKLVGLKLRPVVVILEVLDAEGKNETWLNCIDVDAKSRVAFFKTAEEVNSKGEEDRSVHRFTKSVEVSLEEDVVFTVGVFVEGVGSSPVQRGFINALKFNAQMKEVSFLKITEASHPEKKGMYRVSRCEKDNTLVVGAWIDVFVVSFDPSSSSFVHLHSFHSLHTSFIYNVVAFDQCFFTCSNDCDASLIEF